jgi:hypothetical protein
MRGPGAVDVRLAAGVVAFDTDVPPADVSVIAAVCAFVPATAR